MVFTKTLKRGYTEYMNKKLKFILFSNALFVFAGNLFLPLYALFVVKVGGDAKLAGLLIGLQYFASTVASFIIIKLRDKTKLDQELLQANFLLRCFAWLLVGLNPNLLTLIFAQIISGVSEAIGTPAFNALVSENLDDKEHIKEWGTWELVRNPVIAVSGVVGGFVVTTFGFTSLFLLMSFLAFISFLVYKLLLLKK